MRKDKTLDTEKWKNVPLPKLGTLSYPRNYVSGNYIRISDGNGLPVAGFARVNCICIDDLKLNQVVIFLYYNLMYFHN